MHKTCVCPGINHTHKLTNYIEYHHGVSYLRVIIKLSLIHHSGNKKIINSRGHHHRKGQLVDHKPNNPPGNPHTRCYLLPIRDFYSSKENKQV